ncbi:hypothetical protein INR49_024405, partial [Caranx melampygus]
MGSGRSILQQKGYVLQKETEYTRRSIPNNTFLATKEADTFLIRDISSRRTPGNDATVLTNEIEILSETNHPHTVSIKESFGVYVVMEHCEGGNLAEKIRCQNGPPEEAEFTAENTVALVPKIIGGPYPSLPEMFSPELNQLLNDIFSKDPISRPKANEILEHPFIINCISSKTSDRKAVQSILKEFEQKIKAVVTWLQQISSSLQSIRRRCDDIDGSELNTQNLNRIGLRIGRGIGGIAELVRLVQVMNIGKIAAQASRAVRVAETATGVLSGLFVAVDIFFIAMDAKELYHIKQAQAAEGPATSEPMSNIGHEDKSSKNATP